MATIAEALELAFQHHQAGNFAQAEQLYRMILQANPNEPNALHLLGLIAHQTGRSEEAIATIRQAIAVNPQVSDFHTNLGAIYFGLGRWDDAIDRYQQALRLRPEVPELHKQLGDSLLRKGMLEEAVASYRQALVLRPSYADAHQSTGLALARQGHLEESLASLREALGLRPDSPEIRQNLAYLLSQQGRLAEAEACCRETVQLWPDRPESHYNLALILAEEGWLEEAIRHYQEALRLKPDYAAAHLNLGLALARQGKHDEAQVCCELALRLQPNDAAALTGLATAYKDQGRMEEAIACYRQAAAARPDDPALGSNLLYALHYARSDPQEIFAEHVSWAERFGRAVALPSPERVDRDPKRRLRLSYVSPMIFENNLGRYIEAVLGAHDRDQFEVFCYANVRAADALTQRVETSVEHWRSLVGMSDSQAAERIRADQIDLLVDLSGHTAHHRLGVFALKPAPVQVTHFTYMATTGLPAMDYRLTDPYSDPPGQTERYHTEKLVRLPQVQWCYVAPSRLEVNPLPALAAGHVTFGSFNILAKATEDMLELWALILKKLHGSRMLLLTGAGQAADERVKDAFRRQGISPDRLTLVGRQSMDEYLRNYHQVDICLDTYPFTGCFTTADALWMGVPVVTRAGPAWLSRQGVAILSQVGLEDLIAQTPSEYVAAATRLARDLPRLEKLRGDLRGRLEHSRLMDVQAFTRDLEEAYRFLWDQWQQSQKS